MDEFRYNELLNKDFSFIDSSVSVKNGWYSIVYNLMKSIDWFLKQENIKDFKITELKDKYGRLIVRTNKKLKLYL